MMNTGATEYAHPILKKFRNLYAPIERLIRYVAVGIGAAALYGGIVAFLLERDILWNAVLASAIASLVSQPVAFFAHRAITYRDAKKSAGAGGRFIVLALSTFILSTGSMYMVTERGWSYWIALVICWFLVPAANFVIGCLWVFKPESMFRIGRQGLK